MSCISLIVKNGFIRWISHPGLHFVPIYRFKPGMIPYILHATLSIPKSFCWIFLKKFNQKIDCSLT